MSADILATSVKSGSAVSGTAAAGDASTPRSWVSPWWQRLKTRGRRTHRCGPCRARCTGAFIAAERRHMTSWRVGPTANRSVVGIMNEFTFLAGTYRDRDPGPDLLDL